MAQLLEVDLMANSWMLHIASLGNSVSSGLLMAQFAIAVNAISGLLLARKLIGGLVKLTPPAYLQ